MNISPLFNSLKSKYPLYEKVTTNKDNIKKFIDDTYNCTIIYIIYFHSTDQVYVGITSSSSSRILSQHLSMGQQTNKDIGEILSSKPEISLFVAGKAANTDLEGCANLKELENELIYEFDSPLNKNNPLKNEGRKTLTGAPSREKPVAQTPVAVSVNGEKEI